MQRVSVVGNSGSGKTTLARQLARQLAVPYVELDGIFHQPGWQELPLEEFRRRVGEIAARDAWVVDGNYSAVRDLLWDRADTVVWLDLPRSLVMRRVIGRTFTRAIKHEELWNGNVEPLRNFYRWNPQRSIIRWAWTSHEVYQQRFDAASRDSANAHLSFVRLRAQSEVEQLLRASAAT